ncbi:SIR2 family protein [Gimesia chilikensis]|uniref:SIR2 family protein n=1 Tax=Gimesia chilikensis TaxID=2605989 RepID=UPI00118A84F4|nr:SIR2 family protein [Gimesia chilikensis]QDT85583.1 hypothetical protein MalM14_32530 [Gimesia chilikensis]
MTNKKTLEQVTEHLEDLLNLPRQIWLFGAGISRNSGIPLMYDLTNRVEALLSDPSAGLNIEDIKQTPDIYKAIKKQLPSSSHIEHSLSQIGDLISLAERKEDPVVTLGKSKFTADDLRSAHRHIQLAIRHTVECGYKPAQGKGAEQIGTIDNPIVSRKYHDNFVNSLFHRRRAGLEQQTVVRFVTTNYDTLLEDALSHAHIGYVDGFAGGATGFWDPKNSDRRLKHVTSISRHTASICKLHGSIDWVSDETDVVMRVRSSAIKPEGKEQELLIYPQATKYQVTQRDPFATLFSEFRTAMMSPGQNVLIICGYSFGDDHVNEEIERALRHGPGNLTVLALCRQATSGPGELEENEGLPPVLVKWLQNQSYGDRVIVAGSHGYYRKGIENSIENQGEELPWWTFDGITEILSKGAEAIQ